MSIRMDLRQVMERYTLLVLFGAVVLFFSLNPRTAEFATSANFSNILLNESLLGVVAIATTLPLVAGQIDLSVGPTAGLASLLTAGMMQDHHAALWVAVLAGLATGAGVGVLNGALVTRLGVNSIITTLGTSSIVGALVLWYSGGISILQNISPSLTGMASEKLVGLPYPFLVLVVVAVVAWYVLQHLPVGRYLYSCGASPRAAELVGLSVPRLIRGSFLAAGILAGLAGVMIVAIQGGASPQLGPNFTLPAIAAAFLGSTTIRPGTYNIQGTFAAVFFLAFSVNGLTLLGAQAWVNNLFTGLALLIAVALSVRAGTGNPRRLVRDRGDGNVSAQPSSGIEVDAPGEGPALPRDSNIPATDQYTSTGR